MLPAARNSPFNRSYQGERHTPGPRETQRVQKMFLRRRLHRRNVETLTSYQTRDSIQKIRITYHGP